MPIISRKAVEPELLKRDHPGASVNDENLGANLHEDSKALRDVSTIQSVGYFVLGLIAILSMQAGSEMEAKGQP